MQYPQASDMDVHQFFISSKGDVWLSTIEGLYQVVTDSLTNDTQQILYTGFTTPGDRVRFFAEDGAGNIWVNAHKGVVCFTQNLSGSYSLIDWQPSVSSLLNRDELTAWSTMAGAIVFGTSGGDLLIFDPESETIDELSFGQSSAITHISQDRIGRLYVSTQSQGVWVVDGKKRQLLDHFYEEGMASVLKTFADSNGRLWVETLKAGVLKIDLQTGAIRHYRQTLTVPEDLRVNPQIGIMEDADQTVWLTLKGGGFGYYNP